MCMVEQAYDPNISEADSTMEGKPVLHSEFQEIQGCVLSPFLKPCPQQTEF